MEKVMVYGLSIEKERRVREITDRLGILCMHLSNADLGELLIRLFVREYDSTGPGAGVGETPEMLIMNVQYRARMDQLLDELRSQGTQIAIKAMLTPTNGMWTLGQLREELLREHESMGRERKVK